MEAKKSFGQHFLVQNKIIDRIVSTILDCASKNVLEVGPGMAAITKHLYPKIEHFKAIEADSSMVQYLERTYPDLHGKIIFQDFLKFNLSQCFDGEEFLLCGNFPYNISSQIVFAVLHSCDKIPIMIGMFQKEMAQRICANEGNKEYGILSALTPLMYKAELLFDISPNNFNPPPKVMSSVVKFTRQENYLDKKSFEQVRKLVKTSFQFRRKTLRNNLKARILEPETISDVYFNQRPEDISALEYLRLSKTLIFK